MKHSLFLSNYVFLYICFVFIYHNHFLNLDYTFKTHITLYINIIIANFL